jgi:hypothetical protein
LVVEQVGDRVGAARRQSALIFGGGVVRARAVNSGSATSAGRFNEQATSAGQRDRTARSAASIPSTSPSNSSTSMSMSRPRT